MDYTIKRDDTLSQLAQANKTTVGALQAANPSITNPDLIYAGRTLKIPSTTTAPVTTTTGSTTTAPVTGTESPYVSRGGGLDTNSYNFTTTPTSEIPTQESVLEQKKREAQSLVNDLRSAFASELTGMQATGRENAAIVRARNVKGGLQGSDFADTSAVQDRDRTDTAIRQRTAEVEAKAAAILAGVPAAADEAYATKLTNYKNEKGLQSGLIDEQKAKVKSVLASLASTGYSLNDLKNTSPDKYNSLLVHGNYTPLELDTAYTESLPENLRTKYTEQVIQGPDGNAQLLKYGLDPIKGTVVNHTYDLGVDYNTMKGTKPITTKDGKLLIPNGDGTYKEVYTPTAAPKKSTVKPLTSGGLTLSADQVAEYGSKLEESKTLFGGDGKYVNPDVYQQAYQAWTDAKGLGKDFLAKFPPNTYVNPDNKDLPQYLRSTKKKEPTKAGQKS